MLQRLTNLYRRFVPAPTAPLAGKGERVDIDLSTKPDFASMDLYQKSHYKRYLFAQQFAKSEMTCGDFACGSGYGSALLAESVEHVTGIDIDPTVIQAIVERYSALKNTKFICQDLRTIDFAEVFDLIVSFETIEHVKPEDVTKLFHNFSKALKNDGILVFSTPYLQKRSRAAIKMGFHLTFDIDEMKIASWLSDAGLTTQSIFYQNYKSHEIEATLSEKDFIVCVAKKTDIFA